MPDLTSPRAFVRAAAGPSTGVGIAWMIVAGLCFIATNSLVKSLGVRLPASEAAFLRFLFGALLMLPLIGSLRRIRPTPRQWRLFGFRGLAHGLGVICWFYAMVHLPLAEVTAINYLSPVWVTLGAALFLGETLAIRRITAIAVALAGAAVILRPGLRELEPAHFAMLATGFLFSASYMLAKVLADEMPASAVVAAFSVSVTIMLAPVAAIGWIAPTPGELAILAGVACFATAGHYSLTYAFAAAPLSVTQPVNFLQLVWAVLIGALFFGEPADLWVIAGGTAIVAAVSFIAWREGVARRRARAAGAA